MRLSILGIIWKKEITELLRDRRTIVRSFVLPVVIYPIILSAATMFQSAHSEAQEARSSEVAVWGTPPVALVRELDDKAHIHLATLVPPLDSSPASLEAAARQACADRRVDAVLSLDSTFQARVASGESGEAIVYFDSVRDESKKAGKRVDGALSAYRKQVMSERLKGRALPEAFIEPVAVKDADLAPPQRLLGQILGSVMPFLLIGMSLMGAFYPAIDLSAGEKERGTMQTLLCAPISAREIIVGKFLSVWTMAILMTLANLVSVAFAMNRLSASMGGMGHPSIFGLAFAALLPVTFFISAVFLGLAVFAKDYKDGQNQLMPVFLPAYLLAGAAAMPGVELTVDTAFIPIVNVSLLVKAAFLGEATPALIALTVGSSVVYAVLALFVAARVFEREDVLLGAGSLKKLFKRG